MRKPSSTPSNARYLTVTQGNLNNHHLYLAEAMDLFPEDVLGGANQSRAALRTIRIYWGDKVVETDVDCTKRIFRKRSWLREFFAANRIRAGDQVLLEYLGPYCYRLSRDH